MNIKNGSTFFAKLLLAKATRKRIPLSVIFNLTNRCNSQCKHCYASYFERDTTNEMTTDQVKSILKDLKQNGCLRVSFGGGEPLLRKDIGELIKYTNHLTMSPTVNSNGILVPEKIEELRGINALAISLDGKPEHHDILRGAGSGDKAIEAIRVATQAGLRVHTNTVLNKSNLSDIDFVLELATKHGTLCEFALPISKINTSEETPFELKPSNEEIRDAIRKIIELKNKGYPILFSATGYQSVLECWDDFSVESIRNVKKVRGMPKCPAGQFFCIIEADGTLCPCPHLLGQTKTVNVREEGVRKAWEVAGLHNCVGCYQVYHHEFSMLMNLKPRVLWNYAKNVVTGGRSGHGSG